MNAEERMIRFALDPEVRRRGFEEWKASLRAHTECLSHGIAFECAGPIEDVVPQTAYGDEPDHYRMCERHADDYREHWAQMWADYYAGCL